LEKERTGGKRTKQKGKKRARKDGMDNTIKKTNTEKYENKAWMVLIEIP